MMTSKFCKKDVFKIVKTYGDECNLCADKIAKILELKTQTPRLIRKLDKLVNKEKIERKRCCCIKVE